MSFFGATTAAGAVPPVQLRPQKLSFSSTCPTWGGICSKLPSRVTPSGPQPFLHQTEGVRPSLHPNVNPFQAAVVFELISVSSCPVELAISRSDFFVSLLGVYS